MLSDFILANVLSLNKADPKPVMRQIANYLNVPNDESRFECLFGANAEIFHRNKTDDFDPWTLIKDKSFDYINSRIRELNATLYEHLSGGQLKLRYI